MIKLNKQPKKEVSVLIEQPLFNYLSTLNRLIETKSENAVIPTDDLIQDDYAYGGLIEENGQEYSVTFSPDMEFKDTWTLILTISEINEIVHKNKTHLTLWKCVQMSCGNHFNDADGICNEHDYIDPERDREREIINSLSTCQNREDWVEGYLRYYPDKHPILIIGAYNGSGKGGDFGWFTVEEMVDLVRKIKTFPSQS